MKQNVEAKGPGKECKTTACLRCRLCKAINFEERRSVSRSEERPAGTLYAAEALAYDFYFSTTRLSA